MFFCAVIVFVCILKGTLPQKVELFPLLAEVLVNGNVTFTCSFTTTGSVYGDTTTWTRNSDLVSTGIISKQNGTCTAYNFLQNASLYEWTCPEEGRHSLTLKNVQEDQHAVTWTCAARYMSNGVIESNQSSVYIKVPVANVTLQAGTNTTMITASENSTLTMSCNTSYSRPSPNVYWYLNRGTNDRNDDDMIMSNISVNKSNKTDGYSNNGFVYSIQSFLTYKVKRQVNSWGIYCLARNVVGQTRSSGEVQLNVTYPPDQPVIHGNISGTYKIIENQEANLSCSVLGGNPRAMINLTCAIQAVTTDHNECMRKDIVWNVTRQHNRKQCTCEAVQLDWNKSIDVTLEVLYPPNLPTIRWTYAHENNTFSRNHIKVIESVSIKGKCEAHSNPQSRYMWLNQTMTGQMLELQNISRNHKGVYICLALNEMRPSKGQVVNESNKQAVSIDVLYPPIIAKLPNETVLEGTSFRKTCKMDDPGMPEVSNLIWTRDEGDKNWTTATMQIHNISRTDSMQYTCSAYNKMLSTFGNHTSEGKSNRHFNLDVVYSALIKEFYFFACGDKMISTINQAQTFRITCTVDSNPAPNVSVLFPNGIKQFENDRYNVSVVQNATCLHAGKYTCTGLNIYNNNGGDLRETNLFVRCPPRPSGNMEPNRTKVKSARYDSALLRFDAYPFYDPNPTSFVWMKRLDSVWKNISLTENIQVSSSGSQSNLTVGQVTESDYGEYLLIYKNSAGTSNYTFQMEEASVKTQVESHLSSMVGVVAGSVSSCFIMVAIGFAAVIIYRKRLKQKSKQSVRKTTSISFETERSFTYDVLDVSKRVGDTYSQLPAAYEQPDNISKDENTYMEMENTNIKREDPDYINIRI